MVLQKNIIDVPMVGGIVQDVDPYQLRDGVLDLENGAFEHIGAISKRRGFTRLSDTSVKKAMLTGHGFGIDTGPEQKDLLLFAQRRSLAGIRNVQAGGQLWVYDQKSTDPTKAMHDRGDAFPMEVVAREMLSGDGQITAVDEAFAPPHQPSALNAKPSWACIVHEVSAGAAIDTVASVFDATTGARLSGATLANVDGYNEANPVVLAVGSMFYILTQGSGVAGHFVYLHTADPTTAAISAGIRLPLPTNLSATGTFDACVIVTNPAPGPSLTLLAIIYHEDATNDPMLATLTLAGLLVDSDAQADTVGAGGQICCHAGKDAAGDAYVVGYWNVGGGIAKYCSWTADSAGALVVKRAPTQIDSIASHGIDKVVGANCTWLVGYEVLWIAAHYTGATPHDENHIVKAYIVNSGGATAVAITNTLQHATIYSKPNNWNNRSYLMAIYVPPGHTAADYSTQVQYDLIGLFYTDFPAATAWEINTVGRFLPGQATFITGQRPCHLAGLNQQWYTLTSDPAVGEDSDCKDFALPLIRLDWRFESKNVEACFKALVEYQFGCYPWHAEAPKISSAQVGETKHFAMGGHVAQWDGAILAELGFFLYPEIIEITTVAIGGFLAHGDYWYCACYEWQDARGQIHVSSPGPAIMQTCGGGDVSINTIIVPTLCHGTGWNKLSGVHVQLYRTEAGGTIFYRLPTGAAGRLDNDPTTDYVTFVDTGAYAGITWPGDCSQLIQEVAYTGGQYPGVLQNGCPPASNIIAEHNGRLLAVSNDNRRNVHFSKVRALGEGVAMPEEFVQATSDELGDATALASLAGRAVIWKHGSIQVFGGDGPNDMGLGQWTPLDLVSTGHGTSNRGSVVKTDFGILFKSARNVCLLAQSFGVDDKIGEMIADLSGYTFRSAVNCPRENCTRFVAASGASRYVLSWDWKAGAWSRWTFTGGSYPLCDLTAWDNPSNSTLDGWAGYYTWLTGASAICVVMKYDNVWSNVGGAGAVKYALKIKIPWQKVGGLQGFQRLWWVHLLGKAAGVCTVKADLYYNYTDTVAAQSVSADIAAAGPMMVRVKPTVQKCTAFRADVYDSQTAIAEAFSLSAMSLVIGAKGRLRPLGRTAAMK